jgi:hypothetical protein
MIYTCIKCSKTFSQKSNYNVHINRKFSCIKENNIILASNNIILNISDQKDINHQNTTKNHQNIAENHQNTTKNHQNTALSNNNTNISTQDNITEKLEILCEYCKTSFCRKDVLLKHIKKNCKIKKIFDEKQLTEKKINSDIDELKKEIANLKQQMIITSNKKIKKKEINNILTQNNNINNGQIINNNFNIVSFGDEDIKKLTQDEILHILKSRNDAFINLVKMVHLNSRLPEFHNVLINNIKSSYCSIVDDNKLIIRKKDQIIANVISSRLSDLKDLVYEYKQTKHLSRREKDVLDEIITFSENYKLEDEDIDGNIIKPDKDTLRKNKNMFDDLICAFYNNRSLIDHTLKKLTEIDEFKTIIIKPINQTN